MGVTKRKLLLDAQLIVQPNVWVAPFMYTVTEIYSTENDGSIYFAADYFKVFHWFEIVFFCKSSFT